ncbi:hypothetical protein ACOMHN_045711 [Nucella lapillus]
MRHWMPIVPQSLPESTVLAHAPQPPKGQNLNKKSNEALAKLRQMVQNRTIRISLADKGGAIVVQDYIQYQEEAYRQLDNTDQYDRLPSDPTLEIAKISNELLHQLHNIHIVA